MTTASQTPHQVQNELRQHMDREASSTFGLTLTALLRTDVTRLTFYDGDLVVEDKGVERRWVHEENERVCMEIARERDLTVCLGYVLITRRRPVADAWLLDGDKVIDVERERRHVLGLLGVPLRAGEIAAWTPHQPHEVAVRDIHRMNLG